MTCPNCGHHVREGAKFCDECGIVLSASTASSAAPRPVTNSASEGPSRRSNPLNATDPATSTGEVYPSGTTMLPPSDGGPARRTFTIVAIALIFVLCCCCGAAAIGLWYASQNVQTTSPLLNLV